MDLTEGSETSAIINQTPGNYPKERLLQVKVIYRLKGIPVYMVPYTRQVPQKPLNC